MQFTDKNHQCHPIKSLADVNKHTKEVFGEYTEDIELNDFGMANINIKDIDDKIELTQIDLKEYKHQLEKFVAFLKDKLQNSSNAPSKKLPGNKYGILENFLKDPDTLHKSDDAHRFQIKFCTDMFGKNFKGHPSHGSNFDKKQNKIQLLQNILDGYIDDPLHPDIVNDGNIILQKEGKSQRLK